MKNKLAATQASMNPQVDAFLSKVETWQKEMEQLRAIILKSPLTEELKWGKPCYTFEESNVVLVQGFKEYCALLFCKGALLKDARRLLIQPGENTQAARQLRFASVGEIVKLKAVIKSYLEEAIEAEKAGLEVTYKTTAEFAIPAELQKRWTETPALKTAFKALTPGRQRAYLLYFSAAKQSKTREARIEKCVADILGGKGLNDR